MLRNSGGSSNSLVLTPWYVENIFRCPFKVLRCLDTAVERVAALGSKQHDPTATPVLHFSRNHSQKLRLESAAASSSEPVSIQLPKYLLFKIPRVACFLHWALADPGVHTTSQPRPVPFLNNKRSNDSLPLSLPSLFSFLSAPSLHIPSLSKHFNPKAIISIHRVGGVLVWHCSPCRVRRASNGRVAAAVVWCRPSKPQQDREFPVQRYQRLSEVRKSCFWVCVVQDVRAWKE